MADSGARGSSQQLKQLAGMRGLMAKPSGEIIETPITANFREGLTSLQYFISTHGARKGLADTALKTANSGYLTRRLVDVAQDSIITELDCNTLDGIEISPLVEGNEIIEGIGDRILGRITLEKVYDLITGHLIIDANQEINEDITNKIESAGVSKVKIRSVLTCQTQRGICAKCYGRDLGRGHMVNIGEAIGVIAAQSIGEPGTQLTMRTFHVGGIASSAAQKSSHIAKGKGTVIYDKLEVIKRKDNIFIAINRQGNIKIMDNNGREREVYPVSYGAIIKVKEGDFIQPGTMLIEWDPFSSYILSEKEGCVYFEDIIEGITMNNQVDEITGLSHKVIIESKDTSIRPNIIIKDKNNKKTNYILPIGAIIIVNEGDMISPGDNLAKVNREASRTKDITGGLPRVIELFEARKPKDIAIISEIDGSIIFGKDTKGKRKVIVYADKNNKREYLIPKGKHINVREEDFVRAGDALMEGSVNPHDILRILGEKALAKYMVEEIQEVYRLQGVKINDKHVEVIVRQMLKKVKIIKSGDTTFLENEQIEKQIFYEENTRILKQNLSTATSEPLLLGITKASLSTESFISGASFQETTKVLTEAAISSKIDYLRGLKENVIMGRLIPAGTGLSKYRSLHIEFDNNNTINTRKKIDNVPLELLEIH